MELGTTVPARLRHAIYDDFLPQLKGRNAIKVYREMSENDATIGAALYVIEQYARQVDWTIQGDDEATVELLQAELDGLPTSWDDFLAAALSEIVYGFSIFEIVYARRTYGFGWERLAFRPQSSLQDWVLSPHGDVEAFVQDTGRGANVLIPAEKLIHFRTTTATGKPEGQSWLRRAYRAWFFKKRIEDFLAVGIERDLNGLPHAQIPLDIIVEGGAEWEEWKKIVTSVRVDDQAGLITPLEYDEGGNRLYEFGLLQSQGRSKVDAQSVWRDFAQDISAVMLAQFLQLGRDAVGSRALADPMQSMFATVLAALLDQVEEQFHRQATTRLAELNGWVEVPRVKHGEIVTPDLEQISQFILRTSQAGADWFTDNPDIEDSLRTMAGFDVDETVEG